MNGVTLRTRIVVTITVTIFALVFAASVTSRRLLLRGFDEIERSIVSRNTERVREVLRIEGENLDATTKDWAAWDETYDFMADHDPEYIRGNLSVEALLAIHLDLAAMVDAEGATVFATGVDPQGLRLADPPAGVAEHLRGGRPLAQHADLTNRVVGLLNLPQGLMLVSSRPILTSDEQGPPRGALVFGRWFRGRVQSDIARVARHAIELEPAADAAAGNGPLLRVVARTPDTISGYLPVPDIYGRPAAAIRVDMSRDITRAGRRSAATVIAWLVATGVLFGALMLWGIERGVLGPVSQLVDSVTQIRETADVSARVDVPGGQEWSRLARAINDMLESLDRAQQERRRAEESLVGEKERLAVTLRSIGDGVIATDAAGRVALMNGVAEVLTGWTTAEARGRPLEEVFRIIDENTRAPCEDPVARVRRTGAILDLPHATVLVARDGFERAIADSAAPIRGAEGRIDGIAIVFRDITESRRVEEERLRANKLESAGLLAAGIGHDFNNILTAILANVSLAMSELKPGDELHDILSEAERASLRARDLTQQLMSFSRGGSLAKKPVRVEAVAREAASMAIRGSNCRCRFGFAPDLRPASADEGRLAQVVQNLVLNAVEATPEGGEIVIDAVNRDILDGAREGLPAGRYIHLSISDSGIGIPKEHLTRIFDPYFTTKQKGSGLGLATCFSIVRQHGGRIDVDSRPGEGSTFRVLLPASDQAAGGDGAEPAAVVYRGSGRALLMDDEEAVCRVIGDMLRRLGFEVVTTPDGHEAVAIYARGKAAGRPFSVVLLDLTVPAGMGGLEALQRLREIDPDVCAVVSSGYSNDPVMSEYAQHGFRGMLRKPYGLTELVALLRRLLPEGEKPVEPTGRPVA